MVDKIKVVAVGDRKLPVDGGRPGDFVGRDRDGALRTAEVPDTRYYRMALGRGDIALAPAADKKPASKAKE